MIVVGADGSAAARDAVERAADDAFRMRVPLRVVHAVDRSPYQIHKFPAPWLPDMLTGEARRILREAADVARERQPSIEVTTQIVEGLPVPVLRDQDNGATEIVLGCRGLGGFAGALLGSVSTQVAGHVRCPVVVIRGERRPVRGEIVVGVDDSPECEPALAYAFEQARLRGATLRVLHAWQLPVQVSGAGYDLDEVRAAQYRLVSDRVRVFAGDYPEVKVLEEAPSAHPVDALTAASDQADLLVVGSHGRGGLKAALLGSVSRGVLHHARCPVAVIRSA
ncbi:universal stress protein [Nonomuraea sp. NPDC049421]|uniref:universal stress protein n=1 Tax=Nonomuraea sp. NPDC049421 TaxID=3155275 RepID=UPI0034438461